MTLTGFKEAVRLHFDDRADRYDQDTKTCDQQDFINFETIVPYVIREGGNRILEVATGTGIILEMLLNAGKEAYGLDFSARLLNVAERDRGIPRQRLFRGDAETLPFSNQSFDSTCIFRSLHHIENPQLVLIEMARCSSEGIFVYDSAGGWRRLVKRFLTRCGLYQPMYHLLRGQYDGGYRPATETEGPVKVFYAEDAVAILTSAGFRIVRIINFNSSLFIHASRY